jgi:hypothetical protein
MRSWRVALAALALALASGPVARADTAPGQELARRAFDEGVRLEKKGDYAAALEKFREAESLKATPGVRFHKAYVLEMLGRLATAIEAYEAAEELATAEGRSEVVLAVRARVEPLRARVPELAVRVRTPPSGTEVLLDARVLSPALLDGTSFRIDPGEHTLVARAPEHETFSRSFQTFEGRTTSLDVALRPLPGPAPPPVDTDPSALPGEDTRSSSRSVALPIATTAGATLLATGGIVAFLLAGSAQDDAQEACRLRVSCEDERTKVRTFDALALGGFVGAVGLGALSVVLWARHGSSSSSASLRATPRAVVFEGAF